MVDGHSTSYAWQVHTGDICVLPVGAVEQHGDHLPLVTDGVAAEYVARTVAEHLDAALLPAQLYATSLEHTGFRGSVTLRPETLMQIVRDVSDAMERQSFRILVLVNGHGGNFSLGPVVRDINRMDRALKILLVNLWEYCDPGIAASSASLGMDIHAGEWERSLMLALAPEDCGAGPGKDMPVQPSPTLLQRDLNTFGVGHFNPAGSVGFPSRATAAKGKAIVASIRRNLLPALDARIERLRANRRYAGSGGIALRPMGEQDVPAGMGLKSAAGWNQTEADWRRFLSLSPGGCQVAVHNGAVVGTAAVLPFGKRLAWLSMILVAPEMRGHGVGTLLARSALAAASGIPLVRLDATPAGQPMYQSLGFTVEYPLARLFTRSAHRAIEATRPARRVAGRDLAAIRRLDATVFGADRGPLLESLLGDYPELALQIRRDGRVVGYCMGRHGSECTQVGPVVAESEQDAEALVHAALRVLAGRAVIIDVPTRHQDFSEHLYRLGFGLERPFARMSRGKGRLPARIERQYAIVGPEFG